MEEENAWKNQNRISATLRHFMEEWLLRQRLRFLCFSDGGKWSLWPTVPFGRSCGPCSSHPPCFIFLSCPPTKPPLAYPPPLSRVLHRTRRWADGRRAGTRAAVFVGRQGCPFGGPHCWRCRSTSWKWSQDPTCIAGLCLQTAGLANWQGPVLVVGITHCVRFRGSGLLGQVQHGMLYGSWCSGSSAERKTVKETGGAHSE